jgi:aspartate racemase
MEALCTNTMHKLAGFITGAVRILLLHIDDATAEAIRRSGQKRVGWPGTKFTMEHGFYAGRMRHRFGIETLVPGAADRQLVHDVILHEFPALAELGHQQPVRFLAVGEAHFLRVPQELAFHPHRDHAE